MTDNLFGFDTTNHMEHYLFKAQSTTTTASRNISSAQQGTTDQKVLAELKAIESLLAEARIRIFDARRIPR